MTKKRHGGIPIESTDREVTVNVHYVQRVVLADNVKYEILATILYAPGIPLQPDTDDKYQKHTIDGILLPEDDDPAGDNKSDHDTWGPDANVFHVKGDRYKIVVDRHDDFEMHVRDIAASIIALQGRPELRESELLKDVEPEIHLTYDTDELKHQCDMI